MANQRELQELSGEVCAERLRAGRVGRLAFLEPDGTPMILPVNYRFVERNGPDWIMLRTGGDTDLARTARGSVAFEIDGVDETYRRGWSVVARGPLVHLTDDEIDAVRAHFDPSPWAPGRTEWLVVKCERVTGRAVAEPDDEWVFVP
jgi:nitroimidazol reductase NimA-like FMN-containing flavoprotein (pyridoxamine 5'-phosphate oxidase superfamily)